MLDRLSEYAIDLAISVSKSSCDGTLLQKITSWWLIYRSSINFKILRPYSYYKESTL